MEGVMGGEVGLAAAGDVVEIKPCRCRSRWCERCRLKWGLDTRDDLRKRLEVKGIKCVGFLHFTLDDKLHPGTNLQKFISTKGMIDGAIEHLGELLGRELTYRADIEFGERGGRLHWHALVDDLPHIPKPIFVEFLHWCLRHLGRMKFTPPVNAGESMRAVNYATAYVTKLQGSAWLLPDEFRGLKRFRATTGSRGYWTGVPGHERERGRATGERRDDCTTGERLARCGQTCEAFGVTFTTNEAEIESGAIVPQRIERTYLDRFKFSLMDAIAAFEREGVRWMRFGRGVLVNKSEVWDALKMGAVTAAVRPPPAPRSGAAAAGGGILVTETVQQALWAGCVG